MNQLEAENSLNQVSEEFSGPPEKVMNQLEAENKMNQVGPLVGIRTERPPLQPLGAFRGKLLGHF